MQTKQDKHQTRQYKASNFQQQLNRGRPYPQTYMQYQTYYMDALPALGDWRKLMLSIPDGENPLQSSNADPKFTDERQSTGL